MTTLRTTLGRELLREALPDNHKKDADKVWDSKTISNVLTEIARENPDGYVDILQRLNDLGREVVTTYGRDAALSLKDFRRGYALRRLQKTLSDAQRAIINNPSMTEQQKRDSILKLAHKYNKKVLDAVVADAQERRTGFYTQLKSGVRGKPVQIQQMNFGNMIVVDANNRPVAYMGLDNYSSGVNPLNYWVGASSSRKGYLGVQFATADAGYLSKQGNNIIHNTPIITHDCGTKTTGAVTKATPDALGSVLLRPYKQWKAGQVVAEEMIDKADPDDELIVRSPTGCLAKGGICALCSGLKETGKFPDIGDHVTFNATKAFMEPITQGAVGAKHLGGLMGDEEEDIEEHGFPAVEQFLSVPSTFKGKAYLSTLDGKVTAITPAPQGGNFIYVNGKVSAYVPYNRKIKVSVGDPVEAGDVLTNGTINPKEFTEFKGIGPGRQYFVDKYSDILKDAGAGTSQRNVAHFARAMVNKVRITDPDGYRGYLPGDVVDYDILQADWTPREDSRDVPVEKGVGKYLDAPVLQYSVGTRVTPSVAAYLKKHDFSNIIVNDKEPPWAPEYVRSQAILQNDRDWMARCAGERTQPALFDAARRRMETPYQSTSMYSSIVMAPYKGEQ